LPLQSSYTLQRTCIHTWNVHRRCWVKANKKPITALGEFGREDHCRLWAVSRFSPNG
jgi:hypothetical protein